jgi:COP9 signalosome complex subunit 1
MAGEESSGGGVTSLPAFAARYSGVGRVERLQFVAGAVPALRAEAVRLLVDELVGSRNVRLYQKVKEAVALPAADPSWRAQCESEQRTAQLRLEGEIKEARTGQVKEKIRLSLMDLGESQLWQGQYAKASGSFMRSRDYCTNAQHTVQMSLAVVRASVFNGALGTVHNYLAKARSALEGAGARSGADVQAAAKLDALSGLSELAAEDFAGAALSFQRVGLELGSSLNEVLACEDVALYGGLLAMATQSREQLRAGALASSSFRAMLETAPLVREALVEFVASRYVRLFESLAQIEAAARCDLFLAKHLPKLMRMVRSRALKQYVSPFSSVDLTRMAEAFRATPELLEADLVELILGGQLEAKIDRQSRFLLLTSTDPREAVLARALALGKHFNYEAHNAALRLNIARRWGVDGRSSAGRPRRARGGLSAGADRGADARSSATGEIVGEVLDRTVAGMELDMYSDEEPGDESDEDNVGAAMGATMLDLDDDGRDDSYPGLSDDMAYDASAPPGDNASRPSSPIAPLHEDE